jgi:hypothetical protein
MFSLSASLILIENWTGGGFGWGNGTNSTEKLFRKTFREKNEGEKDKRLLTGSYAKADRDSNMIYSAKGAKGANGKNTAV